MIPENTSEDCEIWTVARMNNKINDGNVNPINAAIPLASPAFRNPIAKPIWLEPGPGKNWLNAIKRA